MAKQPDVQFTHPIGDEHEAETQFKYDRAALTTRNLAGTQAIHDRAKTHVEQTIIQAFNDRQQREIEWSVFLSLYKGIPLQGAVRSNAQVNVPEVFKAVEARTREIMNATFSREPWFQAMGLSQLDEDNADTIAQVLWHQAIDIKFPLLWEQFARMLSIYGTSAALVPWQYRRRRINFSERVVKDVFKQGVSIDRKVEIKYPEDNKRELVHDGPGFEPLNIFDWAADPFARDIQKGTFIGHRTLMTRNQLKHMQERGLYMNVPSLADKPGISPQRKMELVAKWLDFDADRSFTARSTDEFRIIEFWGIFAPLDGREEREYVITMAEDHGIILQVRENFYWHGWRPYLVAQHTIDPESRLYGIGIVEPIASLQLELNDTRNLLLNAKDLSINPMLEISDAADVNTDTLIAEAGRVIHTAVPGHINPIRISDNSIVGFNTETIIKQDIRETATSPSTLSGARERGDETATENINRLREAKSAIESIAVNLADMILVPMLNMWTTLNQQFIREERIFRLLGMRARRNGQLFRVITKDDLAGQYDFRWLGLRDFATRGARIQATRGFLDALSRFIPLGLQMDVGAVARAMASEIFDESIAETFFPDLRPEEILTPSDEHEMLLVGRRFDVLPPDDHITHIEAHAEFLRKAISRLNVEQQLELMAHIENHNVALQRLMVRFSNQIQGQQVQEQLAGTAPGGPESLRPQPGQNGGGQRPVQVVPNLGAPQAPEAQQAQISGGGPAL